MNDGNVSDVDAYWQKQLSDQLWLFVSPVLIVMATIGNTLSVVVLQHPSFRRSSTSFILSALAITDIGLVNTGLLRHWLVHRFDLDVRLLSGLACPVHMFFTYILHQLSSWTLILLTTERVISVWYPLKCRRLCSLRRLVGAWFTIVVLLIVMNAHFFVTVGLIIENHGTMKCDAVNNDYNRFLEYYWPWIDSSVGDFIPFAVIFVGNLSIVIKILMQRRQRILHLSSPAAKNSKEKSKVTSTTVTLMVVSAVFLVLNIPTEIYFIDQGSHLFPTETAQQEAIDELFFAMAALMYYLNSSINFLMYFVSGAKFRQAARSTITGDWCCKPSQPSRITTSTVMAAAAPGDGVVTAV